MACPLSRELVPVDWLKSLGVANLMTEAAALNQTVVVARLRV
ncbi:Uncharacterised protein [Vibrio cholerae]|nr:Uncharacterised protein [Vibrio cholerae]